MDKLIDFFQIHFPLLVSHKYLFLFFGSAFEGMNTMVLGGFLVSTGFVSLAPLFFIFILGETLNGFMWYFVGYFAGSKPIDKWGRSKPRSDKVINTVQTYFEKYSGRAILITKFTFSLTIATMIMAGSLKYDFKKFSIYNFIGSVGWVCMTLFTGYFFGQSYKLVLENIGLMALFLGGAIALVYVLKWVFRSAFIKTIIMHERVRHIHKHLKKGLGRLLLSQYDKEANEHVDKL